MPTFNIYLMWVIAITFVALLLGTGIRLFALRNSSPEVYQQRISSLKVWWILAALWSAAAMTGLVGAAVLLAVASGLGMREFLQLVGPTEKIGHLTIATLVVCGGGHYILIVAGYHELTLWLFPIGLLLLLGVVRVLTTETHEYIRVTAGVFWGGMLLIYGLSFSLLLFRDVATVPPVVGGAGPFLFLVLLTEMNDITQAIVGRRFGKKRIAPQVSPNKSLEGLLGGLVASVGLSIALAPWMTTITADRPFESGLGICVAAGVLISLFGFVGDIHMSAIKRDARIKDGSTLLPGMGGLIDRVDSLIFTGPTFYFFTQLI